MEKMNTPETPENQPQTDIKPAEPRRYAWFAVLSLLMCVAAWIAATISGFTTLGIGAVAIVIGACALRSHRHVVRNTAITSIIATAVLLIVVGAFIIALRTLLN